MSQRKILITGASRGIGRATALHFAEKEGADLWLLGRDRDALGETLRGVAERGGRGRVFDCDVRDRDRLRSIALDTPELDVLVVNAGVVGMTHVQKEDGDRFDDILGINLIGAWNTVRAFQTHLGAGSRVVMMSCVLGRFGAPGFAAYCASKHGLLGLTKALAKELLPRGIHVNALAPAWVETEMSLTGIRESANALGMTEAAFRKEHEHHMSTKRFITPEEVALGVDWLANPKNVMQVGQCLNLDAGTLQD